MIYATLWCQLAALLTLFPLLAELSQGASSCGCKYAQANGAWPPPFDVRPLLLNPNITPWSLTLSRKENGCSRPGSNNGLFICWSHTSCQATVAMTTWAGFHSLCFFLFVAFFTLADGGMITAIINFKGEDKLLQTGAESWGVWYVLKGTWAVP